MEQPPRRLPRVLTLAVGCLALAWIGSPLGCGDSGTSEIGATDTGDETGLTFGTGDETPDTGDTGDETGETADAVETGVADAAEAPADAAGPDEVDDTGDGPEDAGATPDDAGSTGGSGDELPPPPDAFETGGNTECSKDCTGKVCGSDGCGGICGYCTYPLVCDGDGECVDVCQVACDGKVCGPDGCGGICGTCEEPLECGSDGLCYQPDCIPNCVAKVCGPDGCGGDCGVCPEPKVCVNGGCALGPCGTVTSVGECQGNVAVWCIGQSQLIEDDCDAYDNHECIYDGFANSYVCAEKGECVPKCEGKKCGGDGCGGNCPPGCTTGWACVQGECDKEAGADCGPITAIGLCEASTLWFCSNDKLYSVDCAQTGEQCGWDIDAASFACK